MLAMPRPEIFPVCYALMLAAVFVTSFEL
jgi:hypothetical protein